MDARMPARRRFVAVAAMLCIACCVACNDRFSGSREVELELDSSLTIWANLMPTFPPAPDPIHARVPVQFHNLSDVAVVVDAVKIVVTTVPDEQVLHVFRLEQVTDWNGYLPPGGSGGGEWMKTDSLLSARLICGESVVGTLWITAVSADGSRIVVPPAELDPTNLDCVYKPALDTHARNSIQPVELVPQTIGPRPRGLRGYRR